jgi:tungstate transport system substrate-binding protein
MNELNSQQTENIILATTTSTENSGLLDYLHLELAKKLKISVGVVSVGTGAALEIARKGLADVVLVHAKSLEDEFIAEGYGFHRVTIMSNEFVVVGPSSDPGQIKGLQNSSDIFKRLYSNRNDLQFVSRGDNSGTHEKEKQLWSLSNITINISDMNWHESNEWYAEVGAGMSSTLVEASELQAYTLTDLGTWLFLKDNLDLEVIVEGLEIWKNFYSVILVNPVKFDNRSINYQTSKKYVQWLISSEGQSLIDSYTVNGEQLFYSEFIKSLEELPSEEQEFWEINQAQNGTLITR